MSPGVYLKDSSGSENRCQQGGQVQKCNPSPGSHPSLCSFLSTLWREGWGLGPACWITPLFAHSHTEKPVRNRLVERPGETGHTKGQGQRNALQQGSLVSLTCQFLFLE